MHGGYRPGAGRPKGSKSKLTEHRESLTAIFAAKNYDPVACLIAEALNPETPQKLRVLIHKELLSYVRPRQKATEIERVENNSVNVLVNWGVGQGGVPSLASVKESEAIEVSNNGEGPYDAG